MTEAPRDGRGAVVGLTRGEFSSGVDPFSRREPLVSRVSGEVEFVFDGIGGGFPFPVHLSTFRTGFVQPRTVRWRSATGEKARQCSTEDAQRRPWDRASTRSVVARCPGP